MLNVCDNGFNLKYIVCLHAFPNLIVHKKGVWRINIKNEYCDFAEQNKASLKSDPTGIRNSAYLLNQMNLALMIT